MKMWPTNHHSLHSTHVTDAFHPHLYFGQCSLWLGAVTPSWGLACRAWLMGLSLSGHPGPPISTASLHTLTLSLGICKREEKPFQGKPLTVFHRMAHFACMQVFHHLKLLLPVCGHLGHATEQCCRSINMCFQCFRRRAGCRQNYRLLLLKEDCRQTGVRTHWVHPGRRDNHLEKTFTGTEKHGSRLFFPVTKGRRCYLLVYLSAIVNSRAFMILCRLHNTKGRRDSMCIEKDNNPETPYCARTRASLPFEGPDRISLAQF